MADLNRLRKQFLGGDPIAGNAALAELVARGDAAEKLLFASRIEFPNTVQGMYQHLLDTEIDIADFLGKHEPWQRIPLTDDKPVNEYFFLRRTVLSGWR